MLGIQERLILQDRHRPDFARFPAPSGIQVRKPDSAASKLPVHVQPS